MTQKPTILLGMPTDNLIYQTIEIALKHHGFEVISAIQPGQDFHYPSAFHRLKIKFQQVILSDKYAKDKLKSKILLDHVEKQIAQYGHVDYALFIRVIFTHKIFCKPSNITFVIRWLITNGTD
ncbi:hypothetical protein [Neisseria weixii]|uniref:hypothetical protein n=1 Tax=Neisseria weixii TaxID=1853276 RepID=UPI001E3EF3BE|nr:hypothetical protein [Neisseria weixii]